MEGSDYSATYLAGRAAGLELPVSLHPLHLKVNLDGGQGHYSLLPPAPCLNEAVVLQCHCTAV